MPKPLVRPGRSPGLGRPARLDLSKSSDAGGVAGGAERWGCRCGAGEFGCPSNMAPYCPPSPSLTPFRSRSDPSLPRADRKVLSDQH